MDTGVFYLLKERTFLPFFLTQFCGAFNDNAFKLAMLTLISYHLTHNQSQSEYYQAIALAGLTASFFIPRAPSKSKQLKIDLKFWRLTFVMLIKITKRFEILFAVLILSWFWLLGH